MRPVPVLISALLVTAAASGMVILNSPATPAGAATSSIWQVETTVNPEATASEATDASFAAVSASGPDEAWAVGTFSNTKAVDRPLVEHWNGTAWKVVTVPEPDGQPSTLSAVDDLGPDDAWAVGASTGLTLIEHWNGTTWSIVPSLSPATGVPGDDNVLDAISGDGPHDLWAAGWDLDEDTDSISLLFEHWNGTAWTMATSPSPQGSVQFASSITVIAPNNVWAVGQDRTNINAVTLSAHWNGSAWSIVPTPDIVNEGDAQNQLTGVGADGADGVWATGFASNVDGQNLNVPYVLRWNGVAWKMTKVPSRGTEGSLLNGIQVLSPTDAWAVGHFEELNGAIHTLTEQFNGSVWSVVPSPDPGRIGGTLIDNTLEAVGSAGGGNLFAVGQRGGPKGQCCQRTLAMSTTQG